MPPPFHRLLTAFATAFSPPLPPPLQVLGVGFFAGTFWRCEPDEDLGRDECLLAHGASSWANPGYDFDTSLDALFTLFICSTSEVGPALKR